MSQCFSKNQEEKREAIHELVMNADIETVQAFLCSVLFEDERFLGRFYSMVQEGPTDEEVVFLKNQIDRITNQFLYDGDGFIEEEEVYRYTHELYKILGHHVDVMIEKKYDLNTFYVLGHMFAILGKVDMDDSSGSASDLSDFIVEKWNDLLNRANENDKSKMFEWFVAHLDGSIIDYMEDEIIKIVLDEFHEKSYLERKLEIAEMKVKDYEKNGSDWSKENYGGLWAMHALKIKLELGASEKELKAYCKKHWKYKKVRQYCIEKCIEDKDYEQALHILDQCIQLDTDSKRDVTSYHQTKKNLYLLLKNQDLYVKELWELVLVHKVGDIECYKELKSQYTSDEWEQKREIIFNQVEERKIAEFYLEEHLYKPIRRENPSF